MQKRRNSSVIIISLLVVFLLFMFCGTAFAGPGGRIASEIAKTWWGKLLIMPFILILLPLGFYVVAKETISSKRTKKVLKQLAVLNPAFRWMTINARTHAILSHVYRAWGKADIEQASEWMTHWYWQNQKITVLDEWEEEGLVNHCKLEKIEGIKPLYVDYYEDEPCDGEGSRITILIEVYVQDYLAMKETGRIVEGNKRTKYDESVWTLKLENGEWKLDLVEESEMSLTYAGMQSDIQLAVKHLSAGFTGRSHSEADET
jgi:succinate dehydrogenase hydrophobic anchor subunit